MTGARQQALEDLVEHHTSFARAEVDAVLAAAEATTRRSIGRADLLLALDLADLRLTIRSQHLAS